MPTILFLTARSQRHQQMARAAAPPAIEHIRFLRRPAQAEVLDAIADADFLISERAGVIDRTIIQAGRRLRLIQRLGSLVHDIDLAAARQAGVPVCCYPLPGARAVAEHLVWQMLSLLRRAHDGESVAQAAGDWGPSQRTDENVFATNWSQRRGVISLQGRTVGILGLGEIGVETARRLRGFGCRLLYHKRSRLPDRVEEGLGIAYRAPAALLAESHILCNLLPYTPETDHFLDGARLGRMQPGSYVVSCGSGGVIDETALAAALAGGQLAGAALDTFEWEPIRPGNPLLPLARDPAHNVVLTPHTAFLGGAADRAEEFANVRRLLAGEPLQQRLV